MTSDEKKQKYQDQIVLGTYRDGRKLTLVQSKSVPGLYYSETRIECERLPSWLTGDRTAQQSPDSSMDLEAKLEAFTVKERLRHWLLPWLPQRAEGKL